MTVEGYFNPLKLLVGMEQKAEELYEVMHIQDHSSIIDNYNKHIKYTRVWIKFGQEHRQRWTTTIFFYILYIWSKCVSLNPSWTNIPKPNLWWLLDITLSFICLKKSSFKRKLAKNNIFLHIIYLYRGGGTDLERGYGDVRPWRPPSRAALVVRKGSIWATCSSHCSSQEPISSNSQVHKTPFWEKKNGKF